MKKVIMVIVLFATILIPVYAQPVLIIEATPKEIEGKPGDSVTFNVTITNVGNSTAENVTVFVFNKIKGILFTQGFIRSIPPNTTTNITLKAYLIKPEAGVYKLTVVGKLGNYIAEDYLKLKVKSVINYTLRIQGPVMVIYGRNVSMVVSINSNSNVLLYGNAKIVILKDGQVLKEVNYRPMIKPWGAWSENIIIPRPEIGNYSVIFSANFYNRIKNTTFNFTVFRRPLTYEAYFENGEIIVKVTQKGTPVKNIEVTIGNTTMYTDENGVVMYPVNSPGTYLIRVNLDGVISEKLITVERPIVVPIVKNSSLKIKVLDSAGKPIKGITVEVTSERGTFYGVTNEEGICEFNLSEVGYGKIKIEANSIKYLPSATSITIKPPLKQEVETSTTTTTITTTIFKTETVTPVVKEGKKIDKGLIGLIIVFIITLGISSYLAFFRPIVVEDKIGRYYFIKIKAPRLAPLKEFKYEKLATVEEAWTEKGTVRVEGNIVIWQIDKLEPGEEATLHLILA
ncbi:CARDB domain-containing protein [Pyrococcus kukulkanii]|uniref:CARDB domain-containing protein n=1 Tax=Pyrococcus kukulkanii TaxID=1609559 RepID=A0A127BDV2_9EURY|nr:CARDB domain-containing protein [Pyrococcus kukulkanii]AMM54826.1 hypothetical protein TQ32_10260 [Pyrococcus kukulkanii]